jgi:hypothetical protein
MHTAKKEKEELQKKKKPRYSDKFLLASILTPPRQHQKSNISKNNASKKGTVHRHRPIIDLRFHPGEKSALTKQCIQQGNCQAQPIKARPWIFILQGRTLNFSCTVAPTNHIAATSHESRSKFLLATKTQTTNAILLDSAAMIFPAS